MVITNKFTVDLVSRSVPQVIDAVQCDANTRAVEVTLLAGSVAWKPPAGVSVSVAYQKSDGTKGWYDKLPDGTVSCSVAGNTVTALLAPQTLTAAGKAVAAIIFQDADSLDQLATFPFEINVERNPAVGQSVSNDYYNYSTMADVNETVDAYIAQIQQTMNSYLEKAEEALEVIQEVVTGDAANAPAIVCSAEGKVIRVSDSSNRLLENLRIFGKTTQNGTPSPTAPVALENVGAGGSVVVQVSGKNLYSRGDKSVTGHATMELPVPLPPGTYTLSALVSSNDTDNTISRANYMHHNGSTFVAVGSVNLQRDVYNSGTVTIDEPCDAIRFHAGTNVTNSAGDSATWTNIMVEAGGTATAFEPYNGQTVTASTPNGLPGVPVTSGGNYTDANGQQWVCDEIDFARGVYIHRVGGGKLAEVTNWRGATNIGTHVRIFGTAHSDWYKNTRSYSYNKSKGLYSHGKYAERYDEDTVHAYIAGSYVYVFVPPEIASTAEELTAWITAQENAGTPPEIMVALDAEYVVETALSAEDLAAYAALHSNNPDTSAWNDAVAHMALSYVADTKTYIDNKFTELQNAIVATGANV